MHRRHPFSYTLIQIALSLYFIVLGVQEISGSQSSELVRGMSSLFQGTPAMNQSIQLAIGIVALVSGALLLLSVFQLVRGRAILLCSLLIILFWLVRIIYVRFILEVRLAGGTLTFYPNLEQWLLVLSQDILVLCSSYLIFSLQGQT